MRLTLVSRVLASWRMKLPGDAGVSGAQNLYHVAYGDGFSAQHFLTGLFGVNWAVFPAADGGSAFLCFVFC